MSIALSWSRISDWQQCPLKFYLKYVTKAFPVEDASKSIHLVKGEQLHKQLENYVYARINNEDTSKMEMSQSCIDTIPLIEKIMSSFTQVWPERQVAVTYDFKPTEWFAKDVAFRSIWDFSGFNPGEAIIVDYKSGKIQDYDQECGQLHLSAAMGEAVYGVKKVHIFYAYIEHKVIKPAVPLLIEGQEFHDIRSNFIQIYDRVNKETEWKPRANQYCNYCPATKAQCPNSRKA